MITTEGDFKRDRWGRPDVIDQSTGAHVWYTRATTLAGSIADRFAIEQFGKRQVALGVAGRPDLIAAVGAYRDDKDKLNELVAEAEQASGTHNSATIGDAKHKITADVWLGRYGLDDISPVMADEITPIIELELTEFAEVLGVEVHIINTDLLAAGTADRIYRLHDGRAVIGDLKTGVHAATYAQQEIAVQLAVYSYGRLYSPKTGMTQPWPEDFDPTTGIVVHAPSGVAPVMYEVDLKQGWEGATLAYFVRQYRKAETFRKLDPVNPPY